MDVNDSVIVLSASGASPVVVANVDSRERPIRWSAYGRRVGVRLKATTDLRPFPAPVQKIFRVMQRYGAIIAGDFEVVRLGYRPS